MWRHSKVVEQLVAFDPSQSGMFNNEGLHAEVAIMENEKSVNILNNSFHMIFSVSMSV